MKYFKRNLYIVVVNGKPISICHMQTNTKHKYITLVHQPITMSHTNGGMHFTLRGKMV